MITFKNTVELDFSNFLHEPNSNQTQQQTWNQSHCKILLKFSQTFTFYVCFAFLSTIFLNIFHRAEPDHVRENVKILEFFQISLNFFGTFYTEQSQSMLNVKKIEKGIGKDCTDHLEL